MFELPDVIAYPDLVPYQNEKVVYPIQIIGAHKQVLDLDYTVKDGQDLLEAAQAYAQKVAEMTKETFLPISCDDLD